MTQLTHPLLNRPVPQPIPALPQPLWTALAPVARRQLAHCLSDLIRRIRAAAVTADQEKHHESD
jgi:hypothetical protein